MKRLLIAAGILAGLAIVCFSIWGHQLEFVAGGALINLGYRLQDPLADYDFEHHEVTPNQVWAEFIRQNGLASSVRSLFPRTARHPVVALIACMDGRLDTNEIAGDTRRYYYVLRLAGSVLSLKEEEMLELAVANGVKLVVFTTHTDCAAEKAAKDPEQRRRFPHLAQAVAERQMRFDEFLSRPMIRERISRGQLIVKWMDLDTQTERVSPHG
ncbi:MAG: carbonic anhydrase [Bryobacteraceae bacterium]|nr:carbonic anhydrase [Bryobacteraceae bacterium]